MEFFRRITITDNRLSIPSWIRITTWTIGVALLSAAALRDVARLLYDYQQNNVATLAEVVMMDSNFTPPQLVISIPVYKYENIESEDLMEIARFLANETLVCEPCRKLKAVGWDVWTNETMVQYDSRLSIYDALSLQFVRRLIVNGHETVFEQRNTRWNEPILYALLNFFMWQTEIDYFGHSHFSEPQLAALHAELFQSGKTKIERLEQRMLESFCSKMTYLEYDMKDEYETTVAPLSKTCRDLLLNRSIPVAVDHLPGIWIPLPHLEEPKLKRYEFIMHRNKHSHNSFWFANPGAEPKALKICPDVSIMYSSLRDPISSSYLYQPPIKRKRYGHEINIRYSVQMRAKERRPRSKCQTEHSITCSTKCTKYWVMERCGCVSFATRAGLQYSQSLRYCNNTDYESCSVALMPKTDQKICIDQCKCSCEYTSYNWQISYDNYDTDHNGTELVLDMIPVFNAFTELSWTIKDTEEQFIAQLGGTINLYLGLSGLSLFAFVAMCIDLWGRWKTRRSTGDAMRQPKEPVALSAESKENEC